MILKSPGIHFVIFLCQVFFLTATYSQKSASEILALPKDEQIRTLWSYWPTQMVADTNAFTAYLTTLEADFESLGESILARQAWLLNVEYRTVYLHLYKEYSIHVINEAIEEARQKGWKQMEAECTLRKGLLYYTHLKWGPAFEYIQKGYTQLKRLGFENSPRIIHSLESIGKCYYEFGDPEGAIQYLREALAQPMVVDQKGDMRKTLNTIGICFNRLEQYDSALHYFTLAHDISMMVNDTFWAALTNGNKGNILFLQEKYDEAIPLMEKDYIESLRYGEWPSAVNAALLLTTIYLKKGDVEKAENYLDYAVKNKNYSNAREMAGFYKNLATISRLKGFNDDAFRYIDSSMFYKERDEKEKNIKTINQAKLKVEVEQHANQIRLLETARSRQVLIRNGLLFILLMTGIFTTLLFHQQRLRQKEKDKLAEMRQQAADAELENAKKQLSFFTNALKEKNDLVESFRNELELIQQADTTQSNARIEHITTLLNSTILTEDDWKSFRQMFDLVHPGFFIRLKEKMSDLTPAETRLLALTKLQLAPKEMAAMLGISYDAIKKTRQRLRKKINLPEEGSLDELVELI
jgi:tetratricopeptide (TPR) repeat protein